MRLAKWVVSAVGGMLLGFGVTIGAQTARPQQEPDVLPALLTEVRGLRQAMEQMASAGPRVQLALGRLQLQEQRINTMVRRIESVRDALSGHEVTVARHEKEAAEGEERLKHADEVPVAEREQFVRQMTLEIRDVKRRGAMAAMELQRLQAEEASLQQQIANEQGRWAEINRMLEELERALSARPAR